MDSLTQIVLGGAVAAAIAPAPHRRAALLAGAMLGTLPDLDALPLALLTAGVRSRLEEIINRTVTAGKLERAGDSLRLPSGSEA